MKIIGSLAGIVEHLAMYPVDTIKVSKISSNLVKTHMQACGSKQTSFTKTARALYAE